jgi:DNA-binding PadR family transcriptional regulator
VIVEELTQAMSVRLVILGLLMGGEKHPYEMQHILKVRQMEKYIKFYEGSLYYAVEQLTKDGFIEVSGVVKEDRRPDKTVYKITGVGRREFQELLMKQFATEERFYDPVYTALIFAGYGDSGKIADIIGKRIQNAENRIEMLEKLYEERGPVIPRSAQYIYIGFIGQARAKLKWLRDLRNDALADALGYSAREWSGSHAMEDLPGKI